MLQTAHTGSPLTFRGGTRFRERSRIAAGRGRATGNVPRNVYWLQVSWWVDSESTAVCLFWAFLGKSCRRFCFGTEYRVVVIDAILEKG